MNKDSEEADNTEICSEDTDPLIVGIIGCGRLGRLIANCLLTYGQLPPARLKISTRRPEMLGIYYKYTSFFKYIINIPHTRGLSKVLDLTMKAMS